jgi:predicted branched-subunit amino acid permease
VLYSAVLGRQTRHWTRAQRYVGFFFLTDPQFAETEKRFQSGKPMSFVWYLSIALSIYLTWIAEAWIGAVFGKLVSNPAAYGIDFLLAVYFLGLVMGFRKRVNWLPVVCASGLASLAAYHFIGSPWHVSIGAFAGVFVAAMLGGRPKKEAV